MHISEFQGKSTLHRRHYVSIAMLFLEIWTTLTRASKIRVYRGVADDSGNAFDKRPASGEQAPLMGGVLMAVACDVG